MKIFQRKATNPKSRPPQSDSSSDDTLIATPPSQISPNPDHAISADWKILNLSNASIQNAIKASVQQQDPEPRPTVSKRRKTLSKIFDKISIKSSPKLDAADLPPLPRSQSDFRSSPAVPEKPSLTLSTEFVDEPLSIADEHRESRAQWSDHALHPPRPQFAKNTSSRSSSRSQSPKNGPDSRRSSSIASASSSGSSPRFGSQGARACYLHTVSRLQLRQNHALAGHVSIPRSVNSHRELVAHPSHTNPARDMRAALQRTQLLRKMARLTLLENIELESFSKTAARPSSSAKNVEVSLSALLEEQQPTERAEAVDVAVKETIAEPMAKWIKRPAYQDRYWVLSSAQDGYRPILGRLESKLAFSQRIIEIANSKTLMLAFNTHIPASVILRQRTRSTPNAPVNAFSLNDPRRDSLSFAVNKRTSLLNAFELPGPAISLDGAAIIAAATRPKSQDLRIRRSFSGVPIDSNVRNSRIVESETEDDDVPLSMVRHRLSAPATAVSPPESKGDDQYRIQQLEQALATLQQRHDDLSSSNIASTAYERQKAREDAEQARHKAFVDSMKASARQEREKRERKAAEEQQRKEERKKWEDSRRRSGISQHRQSQLLSSSQGPSSPVRGPKPQQPVLMPAWQYSPSPAMSMITPSPSLPHSLSSYSPAQQLPLPKRHSMAIVANLPQRAMSPNPPQRAMSPSSSVPVQLNLYALPQPSFLDTSRMSPNSPYRQSRQFADHRSSSVPRVSTSASNLVSTNEFGQPHRYSYQHPGIPRASSYGPQTLQRPSTSTYSFLRYQ